MSNPLLKGIQIEPNEEMCDNDVQQQKKKRAHLHNAWELF